MTKKTKQPINQEPKVKEVFPPADPVKASKSTPKVLKPTVGELEKEIRLLNETLEQYRDELDARSITIERLAGYINELAVVNQELTDTIDDLKSESTWSILKGRKFGIFG